MKNNKTNTSQDMTDMHKSNRELVSASFYPKSVSKTGITVLAPEFNIRGTTIYSIRQRDQAGFNTQF